METRAVWVKERGRSYRDFEINHLLNPSAHLVVEAKPVFPWLFRREDEIPLALLGAFHDGPVIGANHAVIDVE